MDDYTQNKVEDNTIDSVHDTQEKSFEGRWVGPEILVGNGPTGIKRQTTLEIKGDGTFEYKHFQTVSWTGSPTTWTEITRGNVKKVDNSIYLEVTETTCVYTYTKFRIYPAKVANNWDDISLSTFDYMNRPSPGKPLVKSDSPITPEISGYSINTTCANGR